jgi:hypothetical protein
MPIARIIRWNVALIVAVGFYGLATNEPYWRDTGHGPWLYDYLFWFGLALDGPSGFAADYLSQLNSTRTEVRFVIQYVLWCLLLWPQWKLYHAIAMWSRESRRRQMALYSLALLVTVAGGAAAYKAWVYGHRPSDLFIDKYFWFVRIGASHVLELSSSFTPMLSIIRALTQPLRADLRQQAQLNPNH